MVMHNEIEPAEWVELDERGDHEVAAHENYFACPVCNQAVDRRNLDEVLWHAQDEHGAIPVH